MADAVAAPVAAPVAATEPTAEGTEAPKVRTIDDDFEDVLKKHGGYKYKAAGKEKTITSAADIKRMLSRVDGTDAAAGEALKQRQADQARKAKIATLDKMDPEDRVRVMEEAGFNPKLIRETMEQLILKEDDKARAQANLTQRERELQNRLDAQDQELETTRKTQAQAKQQREEEEWTAQATQAYERLEKVTVGALQKSNLPKELIPLLLPFIGARLDRNEQLGLGHDEDELAGEVAAEHDSMALNWVKAKPAPDLADMLDAAGVAKPLMEEFAKRIRARVSGVQAPVVRQVQTQQPQGNSNAELIRAARTFGSK